MSKNVAVFVDVANIFYAAKAAGVDIDYVTLLKAAIAGRDFVRAYAYTGLDPENENQRQFHSFLARSGYKVVSKDIRKYGDGRIKANLDIELVVDMMKLARNLDVAVVISGDGDFAPAIRAVQEMGVRVEVISFRGNTSSDLIEVADVFTDIVQLARVETGSSRSGRRVAAEGDLSMTEVPDKETEGLARRRRGGTGRRGERTAEGRSRTGTRAREQDRAAVTADVGTSALPEGEAVGLPGNLIVLPGEKLSRAARARAGAASDVERTAFDDVEELDEISAGGDDVGAEIGELAEGGVEQPGDELAGEGEGRRRRRRRGGRGRGRGRGGEQEFAGDVPAEGVAGIAGVAEADGELEPEDEELEEPQTIRLPQHSTFGSVWDSQLGVPSQPVLSGELGDDEFEDEPEIPEYLLAERRRGQGQRGRGAPNRMGGRMGGRNAGYQSAVDRERYGRGGMPTTGSSFGAPRRDDRGGRGPRPDRDRQGGRGQGQGGQGQRPPRQDRPIRDERPVQREQRATAASGDPWTEVPPELEELLREELARKSGAAGAPAGRRGGQRDAARPRAPFSTEVEAGAEGPGSVPAETTDVEAPAAATSGRGRSTRTRSTGTRRGAAVAAGGVTPEPATGDADATQAAEATIEVAEAPTKGRRATSTRRRTSAAAESAADAGSVAGGPSDLGSTVSGDGTAAEAAPKRRARRTTAAAAGADVAADPAADAASSPAGAETAAAPKRRTRRTTSSAASPEPPADSAGAVAGVTPTDGDAVKPKRRTRKSAEALPADS